ncbi:COX15/CtaA family protein [Conexibacter woesei]|uniref:Cytochrome oxidase assembly n=1 Tax=Conexibacter woesei (strain DSM 14684 / CCUG 47730 / CIP 108061 / JCM 11494 / NBRC 100937 / ID131577) TaxID=469383 RepID=D3EZP2_CONWI|nr:COX15/CtaA family protein [Conexibacter woesei]ADB53880.1 cytochrome oxidase assembly [Conexibacter woesei DSM 14684]
MLDRLPTFTPAQFRKLTWVALFFLTAVVLTGAGVRLTGSGLGCPDWPQCHGKAVPPLGFNTFVEYGNRLFSAAIGFIALFVWFAALRRTPRRRDLVWVSALLPLGCLAQGILGGFTVRNHLAPGFVMAHFCLSMVILIAAVWLVWRARYEDDAERPRTEDRWTVYLVRLSAFLGGGVIFLGTLTTAAGPHPGDNDGELVHRLDFKGAETLVWLIHRHAIVATTLGICVVLAWFLARRRTRNLQLIEALTISGVLMAGQGLVGSVQYGLKLPADMVWVHVTLATVTWISLLWAVGAAGRVGSRPEGDDGPASPTPSLGADALMRPVEPSALR